MEPGRGDAGFDNGHIRAVEEAAQELPLAKQARQLAEPVRLGQRRDVSVEVGEAVAKPEESVEIPFAEGAAITGGMGGNHRHPKFQGETEQLRIGQFVPRPGEGLFVPRMGEKRETELPQAVVERRDSAVGRIDQLDRRKPLDQRRPLLHGPVEPLQGVAAKGIYAGPEEEVVVLAALPRQIVVGDIQLGPLPVNPAVLPDYAVHGKDHGGGDEAGLRQPLGKALHDQGVAAALQLLLGNTEGGKKEAVSPAPAQGWRNEAAAPAGADARGVAVNIDDALFHCPFLSPRSGYPYRHGLRHDEEMPLYPPDQGAGKLSEKLMKWQ